IHISEDLTTGTKKSISARRSRSGAERVTETGYPCTGFSMSTHTMVNGLRLTTLLFVRVALVALSNTRGTAVAEAAPAAPLGLYYEQWQQKQTEQTKLPLHLGFTSPINGTRVEGPNVFLHYKIFNALENRELTSAEVRDLSVSTTVCFKLHGFNDVPEICAPLRVTTVTIKDALPAKWHHVTGSIKDTRTGKLLGASDGGVSVFNNLNGYSVLDMCGESACLDSNALRSAYFDYVYRHPSWYGRIPLTGASKLSSTFSIRTGLSNVISAFNIKSMLDAPCGDLSWMPLVSGIQNVQYTGADIVEIAVETNRNKFGSDITEIGDEDLEVGREIAAAMRRGDGLKDPAFVVADLVEGVPASQDGAPFDLVFVRDLMVHLPARHNLKVIQNIQASGARFLMASTYVEADENKLSETFVPPIGHNINLSLPPYCLPEPMAVFLDDSTERTDLRMGLWDLHEHSPLALSGDCSPTSVVV
ncbi:unnamed protein product, partial [Ectocarpus sp. 4 AP-2014]